jgi:exodeoxyribonuclease VII small subunit
MSPGSWEAAMRGVGGAVAATDAVMAGTHDNAFVAMRPPGHHAEISRPMGFCFFDHAAIAARHAQRKYGIARAAVVDFDVHHGNGTQDIFWSDRTVMYCSTHQMPLFPGTGARGERGEHDTIVNAPLAPEDGSAKFRAAFENVILPQLQKFSPELIIISAGFDAHFRDPLASLNLKAEDFGWVTRKLMDVADASAGAGLSRCWRAATTCRAERVGRRHVTALMGAESPPQYARKTRLILRGDSGASGKRNMAENTQVDVKKLSFERAIEELESIVKRLEDGKVPLEESVTIYERGERCSGDARSWLATRPRPAVDKSPPTPADRSTGTSARVSI